jgi:hypothetical protein
MGRLHKIAILAAVVTALAGIAVVQSVGATTGTATVEVRKVLSPSTDSGKFNLLVRHTRGALITEVFNVGNGGHTSRVAIPAGQQVTVEETHGANTSLSDYNSVLQCVVQSGPDAGQQLPPVNGTGMILVGNAGDNYTCTFTNTRKGTAPVRPRAHAVVRVR